MKLAHRVLLLSVALAVTVWPVALVVLLVSRQAVERNVAAASGETAAVLAARTEQIVSHALADGQALAALPDLRRAFGSAAAAVSVPDNGGPDLVVSPGLRSGALASELTAALATHARYGPKPSLDSLWAVDRRGVVLAAAGEPPRPRYPRAGWLKATFDRGFSLSAEEPATGAEGTYRVARVVRDTGDELVGVLVLRYRREQLPPLLLPPASVRGVAVLSSADHLLASVGQPSTKEPAALLSGLDRPALARGHGQTTFRADPGGTEMVVSAWPVGAGPDESNCGWVVITEQPIDGLMAPFGWLQATLLAICLVVMAATMALGRWLSGRVSEPIESTIASLVGTSQAIAGASYQMATASRELSHASDTVNVAMTALTGSAHALGRVSSQTAEKARAARLTAAQAREAADSGFEAMHQMSRDLQRSGVAADEAERLARQVAEVAERAERLALAGAPPEGTDRRSLTMEQNVHLQMAHFAGQVQRAAHKVADHLHGSRADATHSRQFAGRLSSDLAQVIDGLRRLVAWCDEAVAETQSQSQQVGQLNTTVHQLGQATRQAAEHATQAADSFLALATETGRLDTALGRLEEIVGNHAEDAPQ